MASTLIAVGACYLDTILTVDHYPSEDEKLRATKHQKRLGGNVPNTLQVLQQLLQRTNIPLSLNLVATLPHISSLATQQIQTALGPNINVSHCLYRSDSEEAPSSYIIRSLARDSRTLINYNDVSEMTFDEFESVANKFQDPDGLVYHFEGRIPEVTAKAMDYLRLHNSKAKISVEIEKPKREGLQQLVSRADVVFYSKNWAQAEGYKNAEECLRIQARQAPNASYMFCTWGADGASGLATGDSCLIQVTAHDSEKVIDTVGAGDTFIAGVLFGLFAARDWNVNKTLQFANELAGRKVSQEGFSGLAENIVHWF